MDKRELGTENNDSSPQPQGSEGKSNTSKNIDSNTNKRAPRKSRTISIKESSINEAATKDVKTASITPEVVTDTAADPKGKTEESIVSTASTTQTASNDQPEETHSDEMRSLMHRIVELNQTIEGMRKAESVAPTGQKAKVAKSASEGMLGPNPVVGLRGKDMLTASANVATQIVKQPLLSIKHVANFGVELKNIFLGQSELVPDPRDHRFDDAAWRENPAYNVYLKSYLAWREALNNWIEETDLSDEDLERGKFVMSLLTEALAPSNSLLNPTAVKRFYETSGVSLLKGISNFIDDLQNNGGLPSQVDRSAFDVGKNLATTPGKVVFRNEILELIQYTPVTDKVYKRPVLVVPPQINKFYVFDLSPKKSVIKFCVENELQTFAISWRNPTAEHSDWGMDEYLVALEEGVDATIAICGSDDVNIMGACSGGITSAALMGYFAAHNKPKVYSSTMMVSIWDIGADSQVSLFADEKTVKAAKILSSKKGVLDGQDLARVFAWMRPNDLVWNYWVNNYLMGNEPPAFDVLYWNNDTTRLPAKLHGEFCDMFLENPLITANKMIVRDTPIDLKKVDCDTYTVAGITDHITAWQGCYRTSKLTSGKSEFILSSSGHIQSILNPPGNPKARFFTNTGTPDKASEWLASADKIAGSWWDHWREWVGKRSDKKVAAPRQLGNDKYQPTFDAPGTYVHE